MPSPLWEGVREGCGSCEFAGPMSSGATQAQCWRLPPTLVVVMVKDPWGDMQPEVQQHRPWVAKDDWCGEWKRKQGTPE